MLISSQWYTKSEQAPRFSIWYCGLGLGQIIGGFISFGFQHIGPNAGLKGWQIMFIVLGLITCLVGVIMVLILPDTPMKAKWLTEAEKRALLKHVSVNQTGIENHRFKWSQLKEVLLDAQIWIMLLITILVSSLSLPSPNCFGKSLLTMHSDLHLLRCHHNLLRNPDLLLRLLQEALRPPQHP